MSDVSRNNLPIPHREHVGLTTYDAKDPDTSYPPIEPLRPPEGAPNVVVIMIDDAGFGSSSAFGGPCNTPVAERLAANGLRFNRFHTTALCSPTRQALLTARNHHAVGMGGITEIATSAPGYNSIRPDNAAPIAQTLLLNGYSTAQFGKCHEVPVWETSPMGPFNQWPTGSGFEHFYGFVGAETNQWYPALYDGITPVEPSKTPEEGYHFTEDLTDHAITWVQRQKSLMPDKPFFMYFAPGATHAPHHVAPEWSAKYKGTFDAGWDVLRDETLARQKEQGIVPPDTELSARPEQISAWADVADDLKPVLARQMEIYAGFMEHTDHHIGRLLDAHRGARGHGRHAGLPDHRRQRGQRRRDAQRHVQRDDLAERRRRVRDRRLHVRAHRRVRHARRVQPLRGGLGPRHEHPIPVDQAGGVPFRWYPQRHHRPLAQRHQGQGRGPPDSSTTSSTWARPSSTSPAFRSRPSSTASSRRRSTASPWPTPSTRPTADERRETQYFEVACNRGIYHKGWTAVTRHSVPWDFGAELPAARRRCLGALRHQHRLVPGPRRGRRASGQAQGTPAAVAHRGGQVQRASPRRPADRALQLGHRRASPAGKGNAQILYGGMSRLSENSVLNLKNKSHTVTAEIEVPEGGANGVMVAQGGAFAGWSLYLHDGKPKYCHNLAGLMRFYVEGDQAVPPGTHQVRMEFTYDGGGLAKGGHGRTLHRREARRRRTDQRHGADDLLGRRDVRHRFGFWDPGQRGLHR